MKKYLLKRWWFVLFGVLALVLVALFSSNPSLTEFVYSRSIFPTLSTVVGFLPSLVSFSVAEWVVLLFLVFCLAYIAYWIVQLIRKKDERGFQVYKAFVGVLVLASVVYFCFVITGGLNYYRYTFAESAGIELEQSSEDELESLCWSLADNMNQTRAEIGEEVDVCALNSGDFERYAHASVGAISALAQTYPVLERPLYSTPKPVFASEFLSDANIAGIYFPFTEESNINTQSMLFTMPATMAHELAHQCGFMREDEANYIAYAACVHTDQDALVRYSGYSLAYDYSLSALNRVNPDVAAEINASLSDDVKTDRVRRAQYLSEHEGEIARISTRMNDAYLKANKQTDGVQSYGRMVDLLLAEQRNHTFDSSESAPES
ncbi:DUF3810 domain-containing protein [Eggerthellaceae bacterium 3-80]|nr:DUF3810 domain-containing protein [bacterium D16-34]